MKVSYTRPEVIRLKGPSKVPSHPFIRKDSDSIDFDHTTGEIIVMRDSFELCRFEGSKAPAFVVTMAAKEIARRREARRREDRELASLRTHLDILDHFDELTSIYEDFTDYSSFCLGTGNRWVSKVGNAFHVGDD